MAAGGILIPLFCLGDIQEKTDTSLSVPLKPPSMVTATALSAYEVELNWSSVAGAASYNIYRGGINVGSSSTTSFTDSGLSPETTYVYTVTTVDGEGNESSESPSVSVTTEAAEEEAGGGGIFIPPKKPTPQFLFINGDEKYTTNTRVTLSLSAEDASQMAVSNEPGFEGASWEKYETVKTWVLLPGDGRKTVYAKFRSREGGVSRVIEDSIILDTTPPPNVSYLESLSSSRTIGLRWNNPVVSDFSGVKIMRSESFFPLDPSEGIEVFKGEANSFTEEGLTNGKRYYYTLFTFDEAGNFSSGAAISGVPEAPLPPPPPPEELTCLSWEVEPEKGERPLTVVGSGRFQDPGSEISFTYIDWGDGSITETDLDPVDVEHLYSQEGVFFSQLVLVKKDGEEIRMARCQSRVEVTEAPPPPPPEVEKIDLTDFHLSQNGALLLPEEGKIEVTAKDPVEFGLSYEKLPEALKTIMVTLKDGERSFSFLLRVNKEKTVYEGSIYPPATPGTYPVVFHIFNYKNQTIKRIEGFLNVNEEEAPSPLWMERIKRFLAENGLPLLFLLLLGVALLIFVLRRRKKKDEEKNSHN